MRLDSPVVQVYIKQLHVCTASPLVLLDMVRDITCNLSLSPVIRAKQGPQSGKPRFELQPLKKKTLSLSPNPVGSHAGLRGISLALNL